MAVQGDNLFQEAMWHLRQADISDASLDVETDVDKREAKRDARALASSLRRFDFATSRLARLRLSAALTQ